MAAFSSGATLGNSASRGWQVSDEMVNTMAFCKYHGIYHLFRNTFLRFYFRIVHNMQNITHFN